MIAQDQAALHLIDTGGPGGAETVFGQLVEGLDRRPLRSLPVVPREGWLSEQLRACGSVPELLDTRGSINGGYLAKLIRFARTRNVRLIHTHLLGSAVYGALAGAILRLPVIAVLHGPTDFRDPGRLQPVKRWLLNHACSKLVAVSESTRDALIEFGAHGSKISLIRNGVDTALFSPCRSRALRDELGLTDGDLLIGAIGNIRRPKAYDVLIRAARLLTERVPNARFIVIGEGPTREVEALTALRDSLGLRDHFHFLGYRKTTSELLGNFDVFVSSSHSEGLPLSFLEAMACGVCVVATRSGGAEEVVTEESTGLLTPADDPQALAAALERAALDDRLRARLGTNGRDKVQAELSLESAVAAYRNLYHQLLE